MERLAPLTPTQGIQLMQEASVHKAMPSALTGGLQETRWGSSLGGTYIRVRCQGRLSGMPTPCPQPAASP